MNTVNPVIEQALKKRRQALRVQKTERTLRLLIRFIISFIIPVSAAFLFTFISVVFLNASHGTTFPANIWYFFCKLFFPCLPFQVYFIARDKKITD